MQTETLKVISLKRLVGAIKLPESGVSWLAVVFGVCTAAKVKSTDMGDAVVFAGDFIAKGLTTKGKDEKIVAGRSGALILPDVVADMLQSDDVGADDTFSQFVLKVGITKDDKGRPQYVGEYVVKPTLTSPADDLVAKHGAAFTTAAAAPAAPAKATGKR